MSSPSTVRLYSTAKTYGRARDSASRSFDEMMNPKPAPAKASAAHTKWGNTNYVALRDRKKQEAEASKSREIKTQNLDDPFSFDTDEKPKTSPTKVQPSSVTAAASYQSNATASYQRNTTRLPASRIFTRGQVDESSTSTTNFLQHGVDSSFTNYEENTACPPAARVLFSQGKGDESSAKTKNSALHSSDSSTSLCAIARPGRTYTHSHEGRIRSSPTKRPLDQYIDAGRTLKRDLDVDVVYSIESHKPGSNQMSPRYVSPSHSPYKSPQRQQKVEYNVSSPTVIDDDNFEFFPVSYKPLVGSSYPRDSQAHISSGSYDPPIKKFRMGSDPLNRQVADSRSNSVEDYQAQCKNYSSTDRTMGIFGRSVLSSQQVRGNKDTLSVQNYAPKLDLWNEDDSSDSLRWIQDSGESTWSKASLSASSSGRLTNSSGYVKSPTSFQETSPGLSTSKQSAVLSVDDENFCNTSTAGSRSLTKNHPAGDASRFDRDRPAVQTSQSSTESFFCVSSNKSACNKSSSSSSGTSGKATSKSSSGKITSSNSSSEITSSNSSSGKTSSYSSSGKTSSYSSSGKTTSNSSLSTTSNKSGSDSTGNRRIQSGVKQYRIFKSRRPAQPPLEEPEEAEDVPVSVNSPTMPELDLELPVPFDRKENLEDMQHPPDITDNVKSDSDSAEYYHDSQEDGMTGNKSQKSQHSDGKPRFETQDKVEVFSDSKPLDLFSDSSAIDLFSDSPVINLFLDSPVLHVEPMATFEALSPASVDSQELSQDALSSASNSQKEEDIPAAPRRFFKSRKVSGALGLQQKVLNKSKKFSYNARSWHRDENDQEVASATPPVRQIKETIPFSDEEESLPSSLKEPLMVRSVNWPKNKEQSAYTSVRVNAKHEKLYTVVQNVKMAHEVQESGETQDFIDDLEYLLDNLKDDQSVSIRALSTIQLAGKCTLPAFRMHLRAHGTVTKIFSLLHDACSYPSLALSTAALMLMMSQDRLNMDLDKECLHLMLKLNEHDMPRHRGEDLLFLADDEGLSTGSGGEDRAELEKCRHRVQELLLQLQRECSAAKHINVDCISTGSLAMESLLSLTSRRAGEWFKEELRTLGGLDHFVETVHHCVSGMKEDLSRNLKKYTPGLKKLDRCLRVLENITFMNSDNQTYIIAYNRGLLITATAQILQQCVEAMPMMPLYEAESVTALKQQTGWIVFECLLTVLRVLINITHDCEFGCTRVGEEEGLLHTTLQCAINIQWCVPPDQRFDVLVLSLGLLINMMYHCRSNRRHLMQSYLVAQIREEDFPEDMNAMQALVQLFLQRESAARQMDETPDTPAKPNTSLDKSGTWRESDSGIEWIARSAENVRAAEKQQRDTAAGEGSSSSKAEEERERERPADSGNVQEDEENFTKALHKAGKHMENSIVASYVGLLLGCVIEDNRKYIEIVRRHLPGGSFDPMVQILKKFLGFMNLTLAVGTTDANSIQRVIDTLEAC